MLVDDFNIEEFLNKGYYSGKNVELMENKYTFQRHFKNLLSLSETKENYYYVYGVNKPHGDGVPDLPPGSLKESQISERDKYVSKYNADVYQKWWIFDPGSDLTFSFKTYLRTQIEKFIHKIYPDLENNIYHNDSITLYENGDFSGFHADGQTPGRKCVILIYLSPEEWFNDGGGELVIRNKENILESVKPIDSNFCLLDCSKHDLEHGVSVVKNDFKRFTYVNFIYNKQEFEEQKK